ncbi:hypothetical protein FSP39_007172 [Pinctada imbricata]|uniref:RNA helicase n=1 Tax=Pinctada imbricata TaxID=66713 RepID=A0AA89BVW6_PINIB|nr:hypothetical protein FSP39_007172 [Pinctada imbricata]
MSIQFLRCNPLNLQSLRSSVTCLIKCHYRVKHHELDELPRITAPYHLKKKAAKVKKKSQTKKTPESSSKKPLLITCSKPFYNFHIGDRYKKHEPVLASKGWKSYKAKSSHFTINAIGMNPAMRGHSNKDIQSFTEFGLGKGIIEQLRMMNIESPTPIQKLTIPELLRGKNVLCAADTGSGKTLAYLLPVLQSITEQRDMDRSSDDHKTTASSPRAIILVPSKELALQIQSVAKCFEEELGLSVHCIVKGMRVMNLKNTEMDILITSPGILKKLSNYKLINSSNLQHLVLDEADSLLDDSFSSDIKCILDTLKISTGALTADSKGGSVGVQISLVSATMPRGIAGIIGNMLDTENFRKITTKGLHFLLPHVTQKFHRLGQSARSEEILRLARHSKSKGKVMMIFCNKHGTSYWLSDYLRENGIDNMCLNGDMKPERRAFIFEKFQEAQSDILVCTDIASRGLDTIRVNHVVNYEFPEYMSDYIHRVGRVGRVGSQGHCEVTSFIVHPWDVELLWRIETAARSSMELENVNANIRRKEEAMYEERMERNLKNKDETDDDSFQDDNIESRF